MRTRAFIQRRSTRLITPCCSARFEWFVLWFELAALCYAGWAAGAALGPENNASALAILAVVTAVSIQQTREYGACRRRRRRRRAPLAAVRPSFAFRRRFSSIQGKPSR